MAHLGLTPDFWRGRRVLVTGHTGFKGGWLSLWLDALGAEVSGLALPAASPSFFGAARLDEIVDHHPVDLCDEARVDATLQAVQPEIVFHLAAQPLVRESYRDPRRTFASNVMGTVNLLEAVRATASVRAVLVVTSDKCYENREWLWPYRETDAMGGRDPYSASKGCVELLSAAWRESFFQSGVSLATARAGNVIGGGDWAPDRLIPDALAAWDQSEVLTIRYPQAVRPWQYHLDALAGYLMLGAELANGRQAEAWNFGPVEDSRVSVEALLERLSAACGGQGRWNTPALAQPHEAGLLRVDSSKARALLGWKSLFSIDDALAAIVAWHRAWREGDDMRRFSLGQLDDYMERFE